MSAPRFTPVGFDVSRAAQLIRARDLCGIFLTSPENVFYTTGYCSLPSSGNPILHTLRGRLPYFAFVDRDGIVTLGCWAFSAEGVEYGCDALAGFNSYDEAIQQAVAVVGESDLDAGAIGVESTCQRFFLAALQAGVPSLQQADCDPIMNALRLIKSQAELDRIRASTRIVEDVVSDLYDVLEIGLTRDVLMREARCRMMARGAGGISHLTFSFGHSNPEVEVAEPLQPNSLVTLDLGAIYGGYCSDNRRYAYTGPIPEEVAATHATMVEIVNAVGAMLTPGTCYADIYRRALELHSEHGVQPLSRFTHVGHNIGLETEEQWLDDRPDTFVQAGMAINVELYTTITTGEQIGNEETFIVSASGPERVSVLPRPIRQVGE